MIQDFHIKINTNIIITTTIVKMIIPLIVMEIVLTTEFLLLEVSSIQRHSLDVSVVA